MHYFTTYIGQLFTVAKVTLVQEMMAPRYPASNYMFKVNNRDTRKRCEIRSKLTIKTPERRQWRRSGVFTVNLEHISYLVLVFLLLTLNW